MGVAFWERMRLHALGCFTYIEVANRHVVEYKSFVGDYADIINIISDLLIKKWLLNWYQYGSKKLESLMPLYVEIYIMEHSY